MQMKKLHFAPSPPHGVTVSLTFVKWLHYYKTFLVLHIGGYNVVHNEKYDLDQSKHNNSLGWTRQNLDPKL